MRREGQACSHLSGQWRGVRGGRGGWRGGGGGAPASEGSWEEPPPRGRMESCQCESGKPAASLSIEMELSAPEKVSALQSMQTSFARPQHIAARRAKIRYHFFQEEVGSKQDGDGGVEKNRQRARRPGAAFSRLLARPSAGRKCGCAAHSEGTHRRH